MMTEVKAGPFTVRGVSVGGLYTSLHVPELDAVFDMGMALRSFAGQDQLFLSHAHADHIGALVAWLGMRGLSKKQPPKVFMPVEVVADVEEALAAMTKLQRYDLSITAIGLSPGQEVQLRKDLWVTALRTFHPVPALAYQFFRRVQKLKSEYQDLPGPEIQRRRAAGEALFYEATHWEFAYATDTLIQVLDHNPSLFETKVLVLECSFLDEKKPLALSRAGCHIHLDELLSYADRFQNSALVLMHFSQLYSPRDVRRIFAERAPRSLQDRVVLFAPERGPWPG